MADEQEASTSSATPPKKRSPSKSDSPQRSPNVKRKRTQAERYQSDVVEAFSKHSKTRTPTSAKKEVYFGKGAYLAVRSEGGFYLCQTLKYVYDHSRSLNIQWLEETKHGVYKMSFLDAVDRDSVLTQVQLKPAGEKGLKKLPDNEISRIEKILNLSVKKEKGQLSDADGRASLDQLSEQLAQGKKGRKSTTPKKQAPAAKKSPGRARAVASKVQKNAKQLKKRQRVAKEKKRAAGRKGRDAGKGGKKETEKGGRAKLDPNRRLVPNSKIELISKDPMFEVKNENSMPEVSRIVQCKRAIRAVLTNDMPLLKQLLANTKQVPSVFAKRSVAIRENALDYAIKANSQSFIKTFLAEINKGTRRCPMPSHSLKKESTGSYNYISLGHAVRSINVARGSREGNDAFLKDYHDVGVDDSTIAKKMMEQGSSLTTVDMVIRERASVKARVFEEICEAVRRGHRKLAGELIKRSNEDGGWGFNKLHEEVLLCDKPDEMSAFKPVSVKKKPWTNNRIMPLHCAAINPNPKILEKLLSSVPEMNVVDRNGRKVIHYAAACTGSGPLELLLQRGAFADETDNQGNTPLMIAATLNRTQNIEVLVKKLKNEEKGGVFRKNTFGQTPLHYACLMGHADAARALLKHGADLKATLSAGKNKLTPFMVACEQGHLQTVKALADSGAILDQRDKIKRTPLMLSVMNGHVPIAAFLLRKGCDPSARDSSGNTPLHYAAGYGWWFALRLLLSGGANPNALNDWKVPPLGIAFMKGHIGCADLLLEDPSVDVNFRDDEGWTIVMLTAGTVSQEMLEQLKYLIVEKKANAALKDANDWNALHHLAASDMRVYQTEMKAELQRISVEMATLLVDKGCDPHAITAGGESVVDIAIKKANYNADLVKFLLDKGVQLTNFTNAEGENLLHLMAKKCLTSNQSVLLNIIVENGKKATATAGDLPNNTDAATTPAKNSLDLKLLGKQRDKRGFTPLLRWASEYSSGRLSEESSVIARAFLQCLLEETDPDIDAVIRPSGGYPDIRAVIHMLVSGSEIAGKVSGTEIQSLFPALEAVAKLKPDLNLRGPGGRNPLHIAITAGKKELVKYLVDAGADITLKSSNRDDHQATPLLLALKKNLYEVLDILLSRATVNTAIEGSRLTPLHYAAMSTYGTPTLSMAQVIEKLLKSGANINAEDSKGRTPLHYACQKYIADKDPSLDVIELMLDHRADLFAEDDAGRLPLHYLFININNENDRLAIDPIEAVSLLKGAMKQKKINKPDDLGRTPLHLAAHRGAIISIMDIAECYTNIDVKDSLGNTPLAMATVGGHISVVIFFLQRQANISVSVTKQLITAAKARELRRQQDEERRKLERVWLWKPLRKKEVPPVAERSVESLFRTVVRNNWQGILFLLMDRLEACNVPYITPIKAAIEEHRLQLVLNLISKARETRIDAAGAKQQNLLHVLALESEGLHCSKVAQRLLAKEVGLGNDQFRCTPLTYAVLAQNMELCKLLWDHMKQQDGRQILTSTDAKGRNLLATAFWRRPEYDEDLVRWLLEIGATLNVTMPVPLWPVEGSGTQSVDNDELEKWYHHSNHPVGNMSPLEATIHVGFFKQVQGLLKLGADPNYHDRDSLLPIMLAVKKNDTCLVKLLLNYDYNPADDGRKAAQPAQQGKKAATVGMFGATLWGSKKKARANIFNGGGDEDEDEDEDENEDEVDDEDEEPMDDEEEEEEEEPMENEDDNDEDAIAENGEQEEDEEEKMDDEDQSQSGQGTKAKDKKGKGAKKDEKPTFQKTSPVNLSATDSKGRTVIHHMMRTTDYGTHENVELLNLLHHLGAPIEAKDLSGKTPLDYALESGSHTMAEALQRLQGLKKPQMKMPAAAQRSPWSDGCDWTGEPSIDHQADSQALLDEIEQESQKDLAELPKYPKPRIDSAAQLKEAGEVLMDTDQDIPYDILMTKVDVKYGVYGMNNFYKMQIVFSKTKDLYILITRWGRIGDQGQFQRTPLPSREDAITEFCKIFKAKSGNQWANVKEFKRLPGKYNLVKTDPYFDRRTVKKVQFDFKYDKPSKLSPGTQELLKLLTSAGMLKNAMVNCGASERLLPFGHIQKSVLTEAQGILRQIKAIMKELEKQDLTADKKQELHDKRTDLSSEFYLLVPNDNFSYQSMEPFEATHQVDAAMQKLSDMEDLEFVGKLMVGAQHRVADVNPLDYVYRCLDCDIEPMSEDDEESQLILKHIHNTKKNHNVQVERIYRVRRKGADEKLDTFPAENRRLLWHGTKPFNILSILKRGLLVSPLGSGVTGAAFGAGIYHADMFAKSYDYCHSYSSLCKCNFLFINEVALGNVQKYESTHTLKKGFHSLKYVGTEEPDPEGDILLPSGAVLPLGKVKSKDRYWGDSSEYIISKAGQTCLRYLVQIKK